MGTSTVRPTVFRAPRPSRRTADSLHRPRGFSICRQAAPGLGVDAAGCNPSSPMSGGGPPRALARRREPSKHLAAHIDALILHQKDPWNALLPLHPSSGTQRAIFKP